MVRKHRLDPIAHHASTLQDTAAKNLAEALELKKKGEAQLEQLKGYRLEYKTIQLQSQGHSLEELQNNQIFISKLSHAIEQQELELKRLDGQVSQRIIYWQQSKTRVDALGHLIETHNSREQIKENRREQKEMDEFASRFAKSRHR